MATLAALTQDDRLALNMDDELDDSILEHFTPKSRPCVRQLVAHFASSKAIQEANAMYLETEPWTRLAAVLVLIFEQDQMLRVLLTTRGKSLRTHGGQTALPGGKTEELDDSIIKTAFREAHEEVSLPLNSPNIHLLGTLEPHPFHKLIVTPVVALLTDNSVLDELQPCPGEVDHIFSHPLEAILDPKLAPQLEKTLSLYGGEHWPHEPQYHHYKDHDVPALGGATYRWHYFRSSASPITGLTADILIRTAGIAYQKQPDFERYAPTQLRTYEESVDAYKKNLAELSKQA